MYVIRQYEMLLRRECRVGRIEHQSETLLELYVKLCRCIAVRTANVLNLLMFTFVIFTGILPHAQHAQYNYNFTRVRTMLITYLEVKN
jgi:hypothetical protein